MVTTRSRGNKQATGLETAANVPTAMDQQQPTSTNTTTSPLKRKSGTTAPTDTSPVAKIAKTDLGDPGQDMNTEPMMPPVPAPTPVAASNSTAVKQHQNMKLPRQQLPASASMSQPSLDDIIAAATAGSSNPIVAVPPSASVTAPASNGKGSLPAATTAPAPPAPAMEASLEAMKEPEPEAVPLPELSTVLTEPLTQQQPPAPTAPALSTIAAPAPVSASTTATTATGPGVFHPAPVLAATEDPTIHGNGPLLSFSAHDNTSSGLVHPDAFPINSHTNAVDTADLTPIPSAPPLPYSSITPTDQSSKGEAAIASNIGINSAGGGGMAPTAPVVAPPITEHKAAADQQSGEGNGAKPTVVPAQPLSSVI
ncbi:hypothetical protein BGZ96_004473 [Linnemannia gamsii]|uniref:Uncharacterized protein n=1 Tax=Linnemannia gamsii TaxID=64522 RepID=A0ABQ7K5K0_9FUNG|nr:hypothetical protein BGZ96_004473 [Linnemannia gamsii]